MSAAAKRLAQRPLGTTVLEPELRNVALQMADRCQECFKPGKEDRFDRFFQEFANEVDRAVAGVSSNPIDDLDYH